MEDNQVITAILSGETELYQCLIQKYHQGLILYCYGFVADESLAHELAQDTFTKAFFKLKTYKTEYSFSTWLYRIARNTCIDYLRKNKNFISLLEPNAIQDSRKSPEITFEEKDLLQWALNQLSEHEKELCSLFYWHDKTYFEISLICNLPLGTVKTQLHRARQKLKELVHASI